MTEHITKSAELLKHQLGSIDLSDIVKLMEDIVDPKTAEEISSATEIFYKSYFERKLKLLIQAQLEFIGKEATDTEKLAFGRGTFNGLTLVKEWMEKEVNNSKSRFDKSEEDNESNTGLDEL